jgi:hypothetical protein
MEGRIEGRNEDGIEDGGGEEYRERITEYGGLNETGVVGIGLWVGSSAKVQIGRRPVQK